MRTHRPTVFSVTMLALIVSAVAFAYAGTNPVCVHRCQEEYKAARANENKRHDDAIQDCNDLDCRLKERNRHAIALKDIENAMHDCKRLCRE